VIRLYIILAVIVSTGCVALTNFIVGASGNVFSDEVSRRVETQITTDKELPCGLSE
jgi:hypothetical protein